MSFTMRLHVTVALVEAFAQATSDRSSIHTNANFARQTRFRQPIAHGMLPIAVLLLSGMPRNTRITGLSCRFLSPVTIGETLLLNMIPAPDGEDRFDIDIRSSKAEVTTGQVTFLRVSDMPESAVKRERMLEDADLKENIFSIADLSVGQSEIVNFRCAPSAFDALVSADMQHKDACLLSIMPVSTLIGMRMPGRYAVFNELSVLFSSPVAVNDVIGLKGTVERLSPAGNRVRLSLEWTQSGDIVARGTAIAMVGVPPPRSSTYEELSAQVNMGLVERVALVTGASRGIGEATAKLLAIHGAKVAVHCFRGVLDAKRIVEEIQQQGGTAEVFVADLGDEDSIATMFTDIRAKLGDVDILVNNAVSEFEPLAAERLTTGDYLKELNVSLFGVHACFREAVPHMKRQRWGKIINLGTIATEIPPSGQNRYVTAKSALVGYTRSIAAELASDNIQANMVLPRMTETSLIAALPQALIAKLASESPAGRLLQPVDVAKVIVFLASEWANVISGQRIVLGQGEPPFL